MIYRFDPTAPLIILSPTLRGKNREKRKVSMALDTGATYTMIPWDIADALGYRPELSKERVDMVTASGVVKAPLIFLESVSFFGKEAKDVGVIVHNLPPRSYVDGLLGLSFLKKFKICLDFRKGVMEID